MIHQITKEQYWEARKFGREGTKTIRGHVFSIGDGKEMYYFITDDDQERIYAYKSVDPDNPRDLTPFYEYMTITNRKQILQAI
jgi:hypothetical protein